MIRQLLDEGLPVSAIAELLGYDRKTIRKYRDTPTPRPAYGPRVAPPGKLTPFLEWIDERLKAGVWNATVLLRELRTQGYTGGYTLVKDYLQPKRQAAQVVAVRRFETPPGRQAQLDWGTLGTQTLADGSLLPLSGLVCTLGWSRAQFADVATDQQLATLLRLHEAAFTALGGVPREILYDNMKTVLLGYDAHGDPQWHPVFAEFAYYWGFTPRVCKPYRPQTKGKVESGVKYLKYNFLCGRTATDLTDLRTQLRQWLADVANARVHGTTHRVVAEAWAEERPHLQPLAGRPPFPYVPEVTRRVARDAYISYGTHRYSVPWYLAGQDVQVRLQDGQVEIWRHGACVARHPESDTRYGSTVVEAHHAGMPTGPAGRARAKPALHIREGAPAVEERSLAVYDQLLGGGNDGCP